MSLTRDGIASTAFWAGLVFLVLTIVGYLLLRYSIEHNRGTPIPGDPGPFFLPTLCLIAVGITGAVMIIHSVAKTLLASGPIVRPTQWDAIARSQVLTIGFIITLCLIPTAMVAFGTFYVVAVFSAFWIYAFLVASHKHSLRNLVEALVLGTATAIFINIVFVRILTLPLPA